jgi:hypothetical protein
MVPAATHLPDRRGQRLGLPRNEDGADVHLARTELLEHVVDVIEAVHLGPQDDAARGMELEKLV